MVRRGNCLFRVLFSQVSDSDISEEELRILMHEVDQNQNGIIETEEFLQVSDAVGRSYGHGKLC